MDQINSKDELINYFKTNSNIDTTILKHFTKVSRLKKKTKKKSISKKG